MSLGISLEDRIWLCSFVTAWIFLVVLIQPQSSPLTYRSSSTYYIIAIDPCSELRRDCTRDCARDGFREPANGPSNLDGKDMKRSFDERRFLLKLPCLLASRGLFSSWSLSKSETSYFELVGTSALLVLTFAIDVLFWGSAGRPLCLFEVTRMVWLE